MEIPYVIHDISFFTVERNAGHAVWFPDGRKNNALILTASGSIRYEFDDGTPSIEAPSGTCVFLPKGTRHTSTYLQDKTVVEHIQFGILQGQLPENLSYGQTIGGTSVREVFDKAREKGLSNPVLLLSLACAVLAGVEQLPYPYNRLQPALEDMERNYCIARKNAHYAQMCCMSESGFRRLFCQYAGCSPIQYRNRVRLSAAQKLIESGEYSIQEAVQKVGYNNISFFYRSYKKAYGCSPRG